MPKQGAEIECLKSLTQTKEYRSIFTRITAVVSHSYVDRDD